jgi:hypothetical protein
MEARQRWVIGPEITQSNLMDLIGSTIIIADPGYWVKNQAELEADLLELGGERQGMVLWFPNAETRMIWLLRWS